MKSSTSFKPGNKAAAKNPKIVLRKFFQMLDNAKNDENILCYQDACASIGWRDSKCNYWSGKLPVFANLKKDVQDAIIRRINSGSLQGGFNPTASIWRMKQLGEVDSREVKQQTDVSLRNNPLKSFIDALNEEAEGGSENTTK